MNSSQQCHTRANRLNYTTNTSHLDTSKPVNTLSLDVCKRCHFHSLHTTTMIDNSDRLQINEPTQYNNNLQNQNDQSHHSETDANTTRFFASDSHALGFFSIHITTTFCEIRCCESTILIISYLHRRIRGNAHFNRNN